GYPRPAPDSLPAAGQALPDGLSTRRVPLKGFRGRFPTSHPPFPDFLPQCDRPKRRMVALRASVGSTEASASRVARVGVVGPTHPGGKLAARCLLYACHPRLVNGYGATRATAPGPPHRIDPGQCPTGPGPAVATDRGPKPRRRSSWSTERTEPPSRRLVH